MKLNEVFQNAYPWKWDYFSDTSATAEFVTRDGNTVYAEFEYEGEEQWSFSFGREATTTDRDKHVSSMVTGQGDAYQIYATVKEMIQDFLTTEEGQNVAILYFSAHEPSRKKLYKRMLPQLAKLVKMDYKISHGDPDKSGVFTSEFALTKRPGPKQQEVSSKQRRLPH